MKVIFATTSRRKIQDLIDIIEEDNLNLEILTMKDIGWNIGEIEETGKSYGNIVKQIEVSLQKP